MTSSPQGATKVLELLAEIRGTQSRTVDRLTDDWHHALHFNSQMIKLTRRVSRLRSAIPDEPKSPQIAGFNRDVKEFKADVSALRQRIDQLIAMTSGVKTDTANIKTTLDIIQSQFESDL